MATGAATGERSDPPASGFEDSSGVTDIPAFGGEAPKAERAAVTRVLSAYLGAAGRGDTKLACRQVGPSSAAQLRLLARKAGVAATCAAGLRLSLSSPTDAGQLYYGRADVAALRIKKGSGAGEGAGFALFHGEDGSDYWMTVRRVGGAWKLTSLAAQPLR